MQTKKTECGNNNSNNDNNKCIYLKKYKVYNTLCPANNYKYANLGRTRF